MTDFDGNTVLQAGAAGNLGPIYVADSESESYKSARSQDSNHGAEDLELDDEVRTMFINARRRIKKARDNMSQRHNSSHSVDTFYVGNSVSLIIDARYHKSTTPAKLFCKVIHKPQPDMHELQCLHGILSSKYRTDLERLSSTIDLQVGDNTPRIT